MVINKAKNTGLLSIETVYGKDQSKLQLEEVDCLLWAIGRVPNSLDLGLDKLVSSTGKLCHKNNYHRN